MGLLFIAKNGNEPMQRRKFLKKLCLELVDNHVKKRATIVTLPNQLRQKLAKVTNTEVQNETPRSGKRTRCHDCQGRDRKTQYFCTICYKYLCLEHAKFICEQCLRDDQ